MYIKGCRVREDDGPQQDQCSLPPALQAQETQYWDCQESSFCEREKQGDVLSYWFVPAWWLIQLLWNNPVFPTGHPKAGAAHPNMYAGWLPAQWVTTARKRDQWLFCLTFSWKGINLSPLSWFTGNFQKSEHVWDLEISVRFGWHKAKDSETVRGVTDVQTAYSHKTTFQTKNYCNKCDVHTSIAFLIWILRSHYSNLDHIFETSEEGLKMN